MKIATRKMMFSVVSMHPPPPTAPQATPPNDRLHPAVVPAILRGSVGFALVSLGGFAVWTFWGRWLGAKIGEAGMYAVSTIVFLGLSGLFLHPLVLGPGRILRFYKAFIPGFLAYAAVWSVAWFAMGFGLGEWIGSLFGTFVFAVLLAWSLGNYRSFLLVWLVLFLTHSLGYFLGGELYYWSLKPAAADLLGTLTKWQRTIGGRMAWGLLYGLGFGAGLGYAFSRFQNTQEQV